MTGTLRWHSCSTIDFPLKRHKVSKACEACRGKKMRCDGNNPCQRCESNKIKCIYNDKPARSRSTSVVKKTVRLSSNSSASSSTTLSPPPVQQQKLTIPCLNKITFVNELYETLRLQQSPKTQKYGTSTSPLLLDFFNTTSQPQTIWTYFIVCLNKFCDSQPISNASYFMRDAPEHESNELIKETFRVFIAHNLLYGSFINTQSLVYALSSVSMFSFMQQSSSAQTTKDLTFDESSLPFHTIIIYCILAITFQSAHQSLPNMNENFTNNLYMYSHAFYRAAHKRFIATCFPSIPADPSIKQEESKKQKKRHATILVQASILLAHFQCTAISEEQAFMTIKIGLDLSQQSSLTIIDDDDDDGDDVDGEKESLFALLKSLDAWYVWLAFYLQKPYSIHELDMTQITSDTMNELQDDNDNMFIKKSREQKWALYITDAYTFFLKGILKKKKENQSIPIDTIKDSLKLLNDIIHNDNEEFVPNNIISLYQDILTIQLYTCQLDTQLSINNVIDTSALSNTTMDIIEICMLSSQNILTTVNKVIFVEYHSTNATAPLKYVPLSIIYSVCLVSQINLYFLNNKKSPLLITNCKDIDRLLSSLVKMLKIGSLYFEAFRILYSKFNPASNIQKAATISPSPTSLSTSSSTSTNTTIHGATETQDFLHNQTQDLMIADAQHMSMILPMTGGIVKSRLDIDKEQLEKLSYNGSSRHQQHQLQLQQQQVLLHKQQQQLSQFQFNQQQTPNSTYYLQKYMPPSKRAFQQENNLNINEQYYYYNNNQKRSQQQQQLYPQFDYNIPHQQQQPSKRHRSNTATSYDEFAAKSNANSSHIVTEHERSKSVAATNGLIDLEPNSDFMYWMLGGATGNAATEELYDARVKSKGYNQHTIFVQQQQQQQQQVNNNNLTMLPLPTNLAPSECSKYFLESEVQTLHYQNPPSIHFESNNSFPMVGLNVIPEEVVAQDSNTTQNSPNLMYPSHRASIVSDHSSSSSSGIITANVVTSSSTSSQETDAAVWAATAVSFSNTKGRYYNASSTSTSSLEDNHDFQQGASNTSTGHWINSEKVGDEEYWGE